MQEKKKQLLEKFSENDKRIQKQKDENEKNINDKNLEKQMKQEDISDSLQMFENQLEFKKQQKLNEMDERDKRLEKMHQDKIKINIKKRKLNDDLQARKIVLRNKVNNILASGNYNDKDDIYKKVFSEEELKQIQKNLPPEEKEKEEKNNEEKKEDENKNNKVKMKKINTEDAQKNKEDQELFVTQANNINSIDN